jgi:hypothetical protein
VGGEEDRLAQLAQPVDRVPGGPPRRRVEARGGLVEEEQLGVADDSQRNVGSPALATGERADAGVALVAEAGELDGLVDSQRRRVEAGEQGDGLAHGQVGVELGFLEHQADALPPTPGGLAGVDAQYVDLTCGSCAVALEDLDRGRLPRAVGTEEAEDLAGTDIEADAPHRVSPTVGLAQIADRDRGPFLGSRLLACRPAAVESRDAASTGGLHDPWSGRVLHGAHLLRLSQSAAGRGSAHRPARRPGPGAR